MSPRSDVVSVARSIQVTVGILRFRSEFAHTVAELCIPSSKRRVCTARMLVLLVLPLGNQNTRGTGGGGGGGGTATGGHLIDDVAWVLDDPPTEVMTMAACSGP